MSSNNLQYVDAVGSLYLQLAFLNENTELKRFFRRGEAEIYANTTRERESNFVMREEGKVQALFLCFSFFFSQSLVFTQGHFSVLVVLLHSILSMKQIFTLCY